MEASITEEQKSCNDSCKPLGIFLAKKEQNLEESSDNEPKFEVNFKDGGRKRRETIILRDARVSLMDNFFVDVKSCSTKQANINDVCSLPLSA